MNQHNYLGIITSDLKIDLFKNIQQGSQLNPQRRWVAIKKSLSPQSLQLMTNLATACQSLFTHNSELSVYPHLDISSSWLDDKILLLWIIQQCVLEENCWLHIFMEFSFFYEKLKKPIKICQKCVIAFKQSFAVLGFQGLAKLKREWKIPVII